MDKNNALDVVVAAVQKQADGVKKALEDSIGKAMQLVQSLAVIFGEDSARTIIARSGMLDPLKRAASQLNEMDAQAPEPSKPGTKRAARKKRPVKSAPIRKLSLDELKGLVAKAVKSLNGKEFTKDEIVMIVSEKGEADANQVSLILSKYIGGLKKVGVRARNRNAGRPMNVYAATGNIRVRKVVRKSK